MKYLLIIPVLLLCLGTQAQSRSKIIEKGILSKKIIDIEYNEGKGSSTTKKEYKYDSKGQLTEETDYKNGNPYKIVRYQYNTLNEVTKETHLKANGGVEKEIEYIFEGDLKIERVTKDSKGKVVEQRKYVYEFNK